MFALNFGTKWPNRDIFRNSPTLPHNSSAERNKNDFHYRKELQVCIILNMSLDYHPLLSMLSKFLLLNIFTFTDIKIMDNRKNAKGGIINARFEG